MSSDKRSIITGGFVLVTLGVLIFLAKTSTFGFGQSWPILIIVIGISTIIQRAKDFGGWFITIAGVVFLVNELYWFDPSEYSKYLLPAIVVLLGVFLIFKKKK